MSAQQPAVSAGAAPASPSSSGPLRKNAAGGAGILTYEWSNGDIEETTSGLAAGTYYVSVTDGNNCVSVDTVDIASVDGICLEVPSGFSPNADGVNDYWNIYGTEFYSDLTIEVYNRWGTLLFSSVGYADPWNGLNTRGKEVPQKTQHLGAGDLLLLP